MTTSKDTPTLPNTNTNITNDKSPEFTPSMLHNRRGPLHPTTTNFLPSSMTLFLSDRRVLTIFCLTVPPLAVFLQTGMSRKFALSLILYAFFIFPGIL